MTVNVTGLEKIAEGREAEIFAWEPGKALRLLRASDDAGRLEAEAQTMRAARDAGLPVPAPYGVINVDGRAGLIMDRVDGPDLLTEMGKKPWVVLRGARVTGELHARLHAVQAPDGTRSLHDVIRRHIEGVSLPGDLRTFVFGLLDGLPDGGVVCHGDFHPGNIIDTPDGPRIIDWPNATRGHPDADYARTRLILRLGDPPPGTQLVLRYLISLVRGIFVRRYDAAYRRLRQPDDTTLARWEVVRAADRLRDGIEVERTKLMSIIETAYRRSRA
ncbi:MAG TPA: phosphotransferase [Dehalococcoidia bacterium]|nr:phosphotransferase [Dehalococcoidia bacterium]